MTRLRSPRRWLVATAAVTLLLTVALATPANADVDNRASLKSDLCYQIATDRFHDGNPANNNPAKSPGLFDPTRQNWKLYWGGDFAGIEQQLPYLADLGVTAIWMSPHVDNIDVPAVYDGVPNAGYHGYWTRDYLRTEEHFGTLAEFDSLVSAANAAGIKIIMDWVPNHTGPADPADPGFAERAPALGHPLAAHSTPMACSWGTTSPTRPATSTTTAGSPTSTTSTRASITTCSTWRT